MQSLEQAGSLDEAASLFQLVVDTAQIAFANPTLSRKAKTAEEMLTAMKEPPKAVIVSMAFNSIGGSHLDGCAFGQVKRIHSSSKLPLMRASTSSGTRFPSHAFEWRRHVKPFSKRSSGGQPTAWRSPTSLISSASTARTSARSQAIKQQPRYP